MYLVTDGEGRVNPPPRGVGGCITSSPTSPLGLQYLLADGCIFNRAVPYAVAYMRSS